MLDRIVEFSEQERKALRSLIRMDATPGQRIGADSYETFLDIMRRHLDIEESYEAVPIWTQWVHHYQPFNSKRTISRALPEIRIPKLVGKCFEEGHLFRITVGNIPEHEKCEHCGVPYHLSDDEDLFPHISDILREQLAILPDVEMISESEELAVARFFDKFEDSLAFLADVISYGVN